MFTSSQQSATVTNVGQTTFTVTGVYCHIINFLCHSPQNLHLEAKIQVDSLTNIKGIRKEGIINFLLLVRVLIILIY